MPLQREALIVEMNVARDLIGAGCWYSLLPGGSHVHC